MKKSLLPLLFFALLLPISVWAHTPTDDCELKTDSESRDECYQGEAFRLKSPELCRKINVYHLRSFCLSGVYTRINDLSVCNSVGDKSEKSLCYSNSINFILYNRNNLSECNKISDSGQKQW